MNSIRYFSSLGNIAQIKVLAGSITFLPFIPTVLSASSSAAVPEGTARECLAPENLENSSSNFVQIFTSQSVSYAIFLLLHFCVFVSFLFLSFPFPACHCCSSL